MSVLAKCNTSLSILLKFNFEYEDGSTKIVEVKEGQLVNNLTYEYNGKKKLVSGIVRLINFISKQGISGKDNCIHDDTSSFSKYITVTTLNIDCSEQYDCKFIQVPIKFITDIESVEDVNSNNNI